MSRSVSWRRVISDICSWRQDEALNATLYILRETGPTGFLLKEENETKNIKVYLGDPHSCTCAEFRKDKDLCKHICWVLLKKFKVHRTNPVSWQLGLVEREINEILRGRVNPQQPTANARKLSKQAKEVEEGSSGNVQQREIGPEDVCPICQEELLEKRLPVTFCRNSCGNNVHIKCMKVWAEHQKTMGSDQIKCPMCREDFGAIYQLQQEFRNSSQLETRAQMLNEHLGTTCKKCYLCPIAGKCYRCSECDDFYLCQACFNTDTHSQHAFLYKEKPNQRWREALRVGAGGNAALPQAVLNNLMHRDISEQDYDLLLQLDNSENAPLSDLTEEMISTFPVERVRASSVLLQPGQQCRVCLHSFQEGQYVRRLLCKHKFHRECIDNWLLHQRPTCPVDGTIFTNQSIKLIRNANKIRHRKQQQEANGCIHPNNTEIQIEIPGIGMARHGGTQVLNTHMNSVLEISGIGANRQRVPGSINSNNSILINTHSINSNNNNIPIIAQNIQTTMNSSEYVTNNSQLGLEESNSVAIVENNHFAMNQTGASAQQITTENSSENGIGFSLERTNRFRGGTVTGHLVQRGRIRGQLAGDRADRNQRRIRSQQENVEPRLGMREEQRERNDGRSRSGSAQNAQSNTRHRRHKPRSDIEWETITVGDHLLNTRSYHTTNGNHQQPLENGSDNHEPVIPDLSFRSIVNCVEETQSLPSRTPVPSIGLSNAILGQVENIEGARDSSQFKSKQPELNFTNLLLTDIQRSMSAGVKKTTTKKKDGEKIRSKEKKKPEVPSIPLPRDASGELSLGFTPIPPSTLQIRTQSNTRRKIHPSHRNQHQKSNLENQDECSDEQAKNLFIGRDPSTANAVIETNSASMKTIHKPLVLTKASQNAAHRNKPENPSSAELKCNLDVAELVLSGSAL